MTSGTPSLGPRSKRFVATPLLRRNHLARHNEVGRSIWRAQHRLSLSLTKRMAFYFPNLHERLRNHKGPISRGGGGSVLALSANRFCSYRWRPIDGVTVSRRGVGCVCARLCSGPLCLVICVTAFLIDYRQIIFHSLPGFSGLLTEFPERRPHTRFCSPSPRWHLPTHLYCATQDPGPPRDTVRSVIANFEEHSFTFCMPQRTLISALE